MEILAGKHLIPDFPRDRAGRLPAQPPHLLGEAHSAPHRRRTEGRPLPERFRPPVTAPRSSASSCASPNSRASGLPKIRPVSESSSVRRSPIAPVTARYTRNGHRPNRISVRPKLASGPATTMWQFATSPVPPPSAAPWTPAIKGLVIRDPIVKSCFPWMALISLVSPPCAISVRSIPAQNALPLPREDNRAHPRVVAGAVQRLHQGARQRFGIQGICACRAG